MNNESPKKIIKQKVIAIKTYFDTEQNRMVKVDEILKVSPTRAIILIEKGVAIKK